MNFSRCVGWAIPEGNVVQVADAGGRVLWTSWRTSGNVILEVEKITSDTYAGSTTYTGESFILLDIYPKTNGTVSVTYGGLTKTITETSGAEIPNAQEVFFGTFNGVADEMETPASGELVIEGDYRGFGMGVFNTAKTSTKACTCIAAINDFGVVEIVPASAFGDLLYGSCTKIKTAKINNGATSIENYAFYGCTGLTSVVIPSTVTSVGNNSFSGCTGLTSVIIPLGVTSVGAVAFGGCTGLTNIVIPSSAASVGNGVFQGCIRLTSIIVEKGNEFYSASDGVLLNADKTEICAYPTASGHCTIPASVTSIRSLAFYKCEGLTGVTFENTLGWYVSFTEGAESGTPVDLRSEENAATLLVGTHYSKYWYWTAEPFAFAVGDQQASGIYGTTWAEWLESEYNTIGLKVIDGKIQSTDGLYVAIDLTPVSTTSLVSPQEIYVLSDGTFTVTIAGYECKAEAGMTWGEWIDSEYNTLGLRRESDIFGGEASDDDWIRQADSKTVLCTGPYDNAVYVLVKDLVSPTTEYRLYA